MTNNYQQNSMLFQGYKGCAPNKWSHILLYDFQKDFPNLTPRYFNKYFYYMVQEGRDFICMREFARLIFYDHYRQEFFYGIKGNNIIYENNLSDTEEEALRKLKEELKQSEGKTVSITKLIFR